MAITRRWQIGAEVDGGNSHNYEVDAAVLTTCSAVIKKTADHSFHCDGGFSAANYIEKGFAATAQGRLGTHLVWVDCYSNGDRVLLAFFNGATQVFAVRVDMGDNKLSLYLDGVKQDDGTYVITPGADNANWFHLGIDFKIADSGGWIKVYANGALDLTFEGDTLVGANTTLDKVRLGGNGGSHNNSESFWDDIYFDDAAGEGAPSALDDIRLEFIKANANGTNSNMDGSDGNKVNNFELVDDVPNDGDTTYVYATAAAVKDTYGAENISLVVGWEVRAVIACVLARKLAGGDSNQVKVVIRATGGAEDVSVAQDLTTVYDYLIHRVTSDPDGGNWAEAAVNAVEIGAESAGTF